MQVVLLIIIVLMIILIVVVSRGTPPLSVEPFEKKTTLVVMACHASTELKIKLILNNLAYFTEIGDEFVLVDSQECEWNDLESRIPVMYPQIKLTMFRVHNDPIFICHAKYLFYLQNHASHYSAFERVILTNDSFLVCQSLERFGKLKDSDDYDMTSLVASNELRFHFTDFLRSYRTTVLPFLINYFLLHRDKVHCIFSLIRQYEINSTFAFSRKKALYEAESGYEGNIHFDDAKIYIYLMHKEYPVIKLKKLVEMDAREWKDRVPVKVIPFLY